jgi:peptidoglycan/LPS O-acetylase OafA/YrhL
MSEVQQASQSPAPRASKAKLGYLPEFDGFRGIGIMLVILAHLSPLMVGPDFWGAYLLVELFFVISGYLITTLLLRELDTYGRVSMKNFYVRRGLRLLPALFLAVIGATAIVVVVGPALVRPYWQIITIVLTYFGNWFKPTTLGPFTPTWSLAIEEQYYLIWPTLMLVLLRTRFFRSRRALAHVLVAAAFGVALLRYLGFVLTSHRSLAYYSTFTHTDGVILGSALALLLPSLSPKVKAFLARPIVGWVAAGALAVAYMTTQNAETVLFYGPLLLVNLFGTLLVAYLVVRKDGWLNRVLSVPAFTFTGRLSYAMYLYHVPLILVFYRWRIPRFWNGVGNGLLVIVGTYLAGTVSYLFVEKRALKLKNRFGTMSRLDSRPVDLPLHGERTEPATAAPP